jgi:hypothetical protein
MFVACGFLLSGKFSQDALTNFAKEIRICSVIEGKPISFKTKYMSLKVGKGITQGVARKYWKVSILEGNSLWVVSFIWRFIVLIIFHFASQSQILYKDKTIIFHANQLILEELCYMMFAAVSM